MLNKITTYLKTPVKAAPLAVFRIFFGCIMLFSTVRFMLHNWVAEYYIEPMYNFKYYGFEFVQSLGIYTYVLFGITILSTIGIIFGYFYRASSILFFLSFTYCELIDKTTYLNHYYFVSLVAFLMIFLPANAQFSVDAVRNPKIAYSKIPRYNIFVIQFMLFIVYFYAGLAKVNSDWLLRAMPLQIWLPSKTDLPILGSFFQKVWMHYAMSWSGMLYDLTIPFLLFFKRTRVLAFVFVVVFHVLTRILFPIGVFPFVMIFSTLIFFDAKLHEKIIQWIQKIFQFRFESNQRILNYTSNFRNRFIVGLFCVFFLFQLVFPFRYLCYPDELFWTEEGYRFSWRVMLIEKGGYVQYKVVNPENGNWFYVDNAKFLSDFQQKELSTQADFILEFAHFLDDYYQKQGIKNPEIYVESYIALNGRLSKQYIDPTVDLTKIKDSFKHKNWISPFNETIYGL